VRTAQIRDHFLSRLRLERARAEVARLSDIANVEPFRNDSPDMPRCQPQHICCGVGADLHLESLAGADSGPRIFGSCRLGWHRRVRPLIERYFAVNSAEIPKR